MDKKEVMMSTRKIIKTERIELDLPQDVIFVMKGMEKPEEVKKKLKIALAILLFQEKTISLGKAIELAGMSRIRFIEVLKNHNVSAYEYSEKDFEKDQQAIVKYRRAGDK